MKQLAILIVVIIQGCDGPRNQINMSNNMNNEEFEVIQNYKVDNELESFALFFHQDWKLMFSTYDELIEHYLDNIPTGQKADLIEQLSVFLKQNSDVSEEEFNENWLALGAESIDRKVSLYSRLQKQVKVK